MTLIDSCIMLVPAFFGTAAWVLSLVFGFWCDSIVFESDQEGRPSLHFGPWLQLETKVSQIDLSPGSTELVITTDETCREWSEDVGDLDVGWTIVRAATIVVGIMGMLVVIALWLSPCCVQRYSIGVWNVMGVALALCTVFQGLTFLFTSTDACENNVVVNSLSEEDGYQQICDWGPGMAASIISVCCWFICSVTMLFLGSPQEQVQRKKKKQKARQQEQDSGSPQEQVQRTDQKKKKKKKSQQEREEP